MRTETGQAYINYSRCSTEEQRQKGNSHEYQQSGIRRSGVVQVGKLREVAVYSDTVTGTRFDNRADGLDAAFKICERQRGTVDFLFVYRWDRFGRSVEHCFAAIRKFREVGVEVNCPDEWIDYSDPSWPLILSVKFGMAQSENDGFFLKVLNLLSGIDTVFAVSSPEYKNRILKAVFPEGVYMDKAAEKVRTPCVNEIITEICSKSITCAVLEIENGPNLSTRPVKGGSPDTFRTHAQLLKTLFAA